MRHNKDEMEHEIIIAFNPFNVIKAFIVCIKKKIKVRNERSGKVNETKGKRDQFLYFSFYFFFVISILQKLL